MTIPSPPLVKLSSDMHHLALYTPHRMEKVYQILSGRIDFDREGDQSRSQNLLAWTPGLLRIVRCVSPFGTRICVGCTGSQTLSRRVPRELKFWVKGAKSRWRLFRRCGHAD